MEPPSKKMRKLLDQDSDSDSGDDAGGVLLGKQSPDAGFKINEDYARRFEHNKKREEVARLEAKYGKSSSLGNRPGEDSEDSDSEEEDDDAELATEALDAEISATLNAIRSKDPRVYDKDASFYSKYDPEEADAGKGPKEKSMTLRQYHTENLLSGVNPAEEEDTPRTYAQEQADLKNAIVKEMHGAADKSDEEMEDADEFMVRKPGQDISMPKSEIKVDVENADKDPETFLSNFLSARAWIPTDKPELHPFDSDEDDDIERAEAMEEAYNFRFEDPNKLNEVIVTHSRDLTNQQSVRREDKSSRKKIRDAERALKEEEKKQRETEKNRLRKLKTEELQKKVEQIKEVAGLRASHFTDDDWSRFLDASWDDSNWESEMQKRFGEDYYAGEEGEGSENEGSKKKKHPKKPTWDDDIDINDLVPDYEEEEAKPTLELSEAEDEDDDEASGSKKKSKAEEKRMQKREARKDRLRIDDAVERNLDLDITLLPGATKKNATKFRYRETSPESFGLTARDILMADDTQLNKFAGLKKLATFREEEQKRRDQKKLGKKARLREWRKDTFGDENGPEFKFGGDFQPSQPEEIAGEDKVDIREGDGTRKKRKRSKKH
ncbi:KRR1 interacting protein 1 [Penicillium concentricum]|uniref:KRR1 interacting protein 1 n=1 Tax=Penicillium concentricum TaxID=293559 RepID=A0A9W9VJN5_9EURO|nr:KRR1 interacting protein 1 [Penicillium concentricum]KAJ5384683.1 KRR1 interacting protein 1 [Penicillium concentricum]